MARSIGNTGVDEPVKSGMNYGPRPVGMKLMQLRYHIFLLSVFGLCLASGHVARCQSSGLGFKAGGQITTARASGATARPMAGAVLGLYGTVYGGPRLELQPELLLNMQGRVLAEGENGFAGLRFYYAQLPLSAKFFIGNTFNIAAGPQAGKLLYAQQFGDTTINITNDVNKWDFGMNAGIGADLRSGWDFTLRYYSGLSSVMKSEQSTLPLHRSTQLTIGYRFAKWRHKARRGRTRK